jgi:hypothetical protein
MGKILTNLEFIKKLPDNIKNNYDILEDYKGCKQKLLIKCKCTKLLYNCNTEKLLIGNKPSIKSAVNKSEILSHRIKQLHPTLMLLTFSDNIKDYIIVSDQHNIRYKISQDSLLQGRCPTIDSAISKNEYIKTKGNTIHDNKYNYTNLDYKNAKTKLSIICPIHGEFKQQLNAHINGSGCIKCVKRKGGYNLTNWENTAKNSKNFDNFKLYIIEIWDSNEKFYKIGRTFTTTNFRFYGNTKLPYNYKIIKEILGTPQEIFELEKLLHKQHKLYSYNPLKFFNGLTECFSYINI